VLGALLILAGAALLSWQGAAEGVRWGGREPLLAKPYDQREVVRRIEAMLTRAARSTP
jgi:DNA-binding response OmpR family regulator